MINYQNIQDSIDHFNNENFKRVESPWTVTKEIADITMPPGWEHFSITEKNKVLVGSGEQSFLYLYLKEFLPKGKFQTVTPCFRNNSFDLTHSKYFIKNELIDTEEPNQKGLRDMLDGAMVFLKQKYQETF
jgi:seryl-tRNA synthetase